MKFNDPVTVLGAMTCGQVAGRLLEAALRQLWTRARAALARWLRRLVNGPDQAPKLAP
ncbi:hypothetical protein [Parafrankia sp. EUN1f]|uniref:hypothetical protein n=1 Tax=Parafrankia sp. EUN1f TaxID=102897 RepID=UPI0001C474E9|nr:hypothetical protein [Parafrankia sp. EUN1f]EFC79674.1 hypothetical protein FrEUN1fDRAFT_7211 [Parafrankia sp. EUN1f]